MLQRNSRLFSGIILWWLVLQQPSVFLQSSLSLLEYVNYNYSKTSLSCPLMGPAEMDNLERRILYYQLKTVNKLKCGTRKISQLMEVAR